MITHDNFGTPTGWFADLSDVDGLDVEDDRIDKFPWQPFIQTAGGCFPLPIWHETKEDCEEFIRKDILGRAMLPSRG